MSPHPLLALCFLRGFACLPELGKRSTIPSGLIMAWATPCFFSCLRRLETFRRTPLIFPRIRHVGVIVPRTWGPSTRTGRERRVEWMGTEFDEKWEVFTREKKSAVFNFWRSEIQLRRCDADRAAASSSQSPFSSQKFSPKNFHFSFEHMYETLNVIK